MGMEIFTLVTGVIYVILEIKQKNLMWIVGIITSLAAMYMFFTQRLYASFALNVYYFLIAFWGLYQWRNDAGRIAGVQPDNKSDEQPESRSSDCSSERRSEGKSEDIIHLNRLGWKTIAGCCIGFAAGLALLRFALLKLEDPMSGLDAGVAVLSAVATYMLTRSYKEQWLLWIVADTLSSVLCAAQGMYWMTALYVVYTMSAAYGYYHWKKHGVYVDDNL